MQKSRINWIDAGKGIGILLVLFGHTFRDSMRSEYFVCNALYTFIYTFHMPFLMYLSGYMFSVKSDYYLKCDVRNYLYSQFRRLIKPYLFYAIAIYLIVIICFQIEFTRNLLALAGYKKIGIFDFLIGVLNGENPYSFHLWYIYCLAVLSIIGFIIWKVTEKNTIHKFRKFIVCGFVVVAIFFSAFLSDTINVPRIVSAVLMMIPWYFMGCFKLSDKLSSTFKCMIGIISILLLLLFGFDVIPISNIIYAFIKYPIIAGAILGMIILSDKLAHSKPLTYLGRKSMSIYLFHQPFIAAGSGVFFYDLLGLSVISTIMLSFVLSLVLPLCIDKVFSKFPLWKKIF